jgi:hypothetical protein
MRDIRRPPCRGALACWLGFAACVGLGAGLPACGLNQEGVPPPRDRIVYPASARLDSHGQWLYVANSNSDLRYNNGTLVAVDVEAAEADYDPEHRKWRVCPRADYVRSYDVGLDDVDKEGIGRCCWDYLDHTVLDCDERKYVHGASTIEIGSFAAGMEFQETETMDFPQPAQTRHQCSYLRPAPQGDAGVDASGEAGAEADGGGGAAADGGVDAIAPTVTPGRLFIGVRGNSSITYIDTKADSSSGAPLLSCGSATKDSKACSIAQTVFQTNKTTLTVPDEPYALYLDKSADLLYAGHLRGDTAHPDTGGVSLFDVARKNPDRPPVYLHSSRGFFPADQNGFFGVTSLTFNADDQRLYATSRYTPMAVGLSTSIDPQRVCSDDPIFVSASSVPFSSPLAGGEMRGLQFTSPKRAFALQRVPPALIGFDVTGGILGNVPTDIVETCAAPTFLQPSPKGTEKRFFVTCFEAGQIYVVDPAIPGVVAVIEAGRGPAGLVFPENPTTPARAYIVGFGHNNVSVVDLQPGSRTQYHVIQKLGFPSVLPR